MEINLPDKGIFKGIGPLERILNINKKNFPKIRNFHQFSYEHGHPNQYQTTFNKFHQSRKFSIADYMTSQNRVKKNTNQSHWSLALPDSQRFRLKKMSQQDKTFLSLNQSSYKKQPYNPPLKQIVHSQEGLGFGDRIDVQKNYHPQKTKGKRMFNKFSQLVNDHKATKGQGNNQERQSFQGSGGYLAFNTNKNFNNANSSAFKFGLNEAKSSHQFHQFEKSYKSVDKSKFHTTTNMEHFQNPSKITVKNVNYKFDRNRRFNPITGVQMGKTTAFAYEDFNEGVKSNYKANNFTRIQRGGKKQDIITGRMIDY